MMRKIFTIWMALFLLSGAAYAQDFIISGPSSVSVAGGEVCLRLRIPTGNVGVTVTGSFTGTLLFQGTINGTSRFSVRAVVPGTLTASTSTTTAGNFTIQVGSFSQVCVVADVGFSGTATIFLYATRGVNQQFEVGGGGSGGTVDTELTTAAAAADSMANPTAGGVLNYNLCFNQTTSLWDRCRTSSAVEVTDSASTATGQVGALTSAMNLGYDGSVWRRLTFGTAGTPSAQVWSVQETGAALTALQLLDDSQTGDSVNYRTATGTAQDETEIKATAGRIFTAVLSNTNAAARYFRCYNLTAAATTPGTSTVFFGWAIPPTNTVTHTFGPNGIAFTALTCTLTTGAADTDTQSVAANEIKWTLSFK